jgi:hypothetical protein
MGILLFFCLSEGFYALYPSEPYPIVAFQGRTLAEVLAASREMEEELTREGDEALRGHSVQPPDGCTPKNRRQ